MNSAILLLPNFLGKSVGVHRNGHLSWFHRPSHYKIHLIQPTLTLITYSHSLFLSHAHSFKHKQILSLFFFFTRSHTNKQTKETQTSMEIYNTDVIIVGAGPAGLATSACLNLKGIPNIVLEREGCSASLWKERAYDRLKLHLGKEFCHLPHKQIPDDEPRFVPREGFIRYLDDYATSFQVHPFFHRNVESACFDATSCKWVVEAQNSLTGAAETYSTGFLVVATGENSHGIIPRIPGLYSYDGVTIHSSQYTNGKMFSRKNVLVVGCGNSGMEIAYDLATSGAQTTIVIRNPVHVLKKEMVYIGLKLLKYLPLNIVDNFLILLTRFWFGNLNKFGIERPQKGPFFLKGLTGRSPVLDVGTVNQIKEGKIMVVSSIERIDGYGVKFSDGQIRDFDAIIFATGYKSTVGRWMKDDQRLFNEDGMPKRKKPNHWKGEDGLYCAGFSSSGLFGISLDAMLIADDISSILENKNKKN